MTVKLIKHTGEYDYPDDPSLPFRLEMVLRPSGFMVVTWALLYGGSEYIVARGDSAEELSSWMAEHGLKNHSRLVRYSIVNSNSKVIDSLDRQNPQVGTPPKNTVENPTSGA
jgi:hypothetical protein